MREKPVCVLQALSIDRATMLKRSEIYPNCNLRQNVWIRFNVLAQFSFTTSERRLNYYHQKVNVRVTDEQISALLVCINYCI